jgi:hypothetical protein
MQIVIAERDDGRFTQRMHAPQHRERLRTAIDEIADEPEPVAVGGESDACQQGAELAVAALHVADREDATQCKTPGMASRKGAMGASNRRPSSATI